MTGTETRRPLLLPWVALGLALMLLSALPGAAEARVIDLEEEEITVDLETPEANYILSPSIPDWRLRPPVASFLDALEETLEDAPF